MIIKPNTKLCIGSDVPEDRIKLQLLNTEPGVVEAAGFLANGRVVLYLDSPISHYLGFEADSSHLGPVRNEYNPAISVNGWAKEQGLGMATTPNEAAFIDALNDLVWQASFCRDTKYDKAFIRSVSATSDYCKLGEVSGCRLDSEKEMERPVKAVHVILQGSLYEKVFGE